MARDIMRNYLLILADGSGSMGPQYKGKGTKPIEELSAALNEFVSKDVLRINALSKRGEIAVGLFRGNGGDIVEWQQLASAESPSHPFYRVGDGLTMPSIFASGQTPLVDACVEGIEVLTRRRRSMAEYALEYKPIVVLITDGEPSPGQDVGALSNMVRERAYRTGVTGAEFLFLAFGTQGANMETLERIAPLSCWDLRNKTIGESIKLVSESVRRSFNAPRPTAESPTYKPSEHPDYASIYEFLGDPFQSMRA